MDWFTTLPGIDELDTAEAFFAYFDLPWDPAVIRSKRLHIMHEFNRRLGAVIDVPPSEPAVDRTGPIARHTVRWALARHLLDQSYRHFLQGDVAVKSGLSVYQRNQPSFVPWSQLTEVIS